MNTDGRFHPDIEHYVRFVSKRQRLSLSKSGIVALRRRLRANNSGEKLPIVEIGAICADSVAGRARSIPLRRYLPENMATGPQPAILFFHGGGWVSGDLDSHDEICRTMVKLSGTQLIAIDYRLAPEHPFPAAVEDAIDSYAMLLARAGEWGVDSRRIAVMGDGTGGTLASIVAIHAREMCQPVPICQMLFYPVTTMAEESESFRKEELHELCGISPDIVRWLYRQYLRDHDELKDWRVSPLHVGSMAGLPPTFIAVGDKDPLHDEAIALADRLYKAGVTTRLLVLPGQIYGYLSLGGVTEAATQSLRYAADLLSEYLAQHKQATRRRQA